MITYSQWQAELSGATRVAEARGAAWHSKVGCLYTNLRLRLPGSLAERHCLFREATQLKTVGVVCYVVGIGPLCAED